MPSNRNNRIRLRDARDLYLLVGECRALGGDAMGWRQHLVSRSRKLLDADMICFADAITRGEPWLEEGWVKPISMIDEWEHEEARHFFWQMVRRGRVEDMPFGIVLSEALASKSGIRVATRRDLMDDEAWRENPFFQQEPAKVRMDDFVMGFMVGEEQSFQMLFAQRERGREPFSRRHVHAIKAILIELGRLQPHELSSLDDSAFMTLPPRMLQVLACLLGGSTVKEAATMLDISPHTVQEHVKRLYKRSGTKNRAELADFYRHVAPRILEMTLEDPPDHQKQLNEAIRKPWPVEPNRETDDADR